MIKIEFPFAPLGFNNAYAGKKRRFLTPKAKSFKERVFEIASAHSLDFDPLTEALAVDYTFTLERITTPKGKIHANRHDYDGMIKLFQDSMFKALGVDDSYIIDAKIRKREGSPKMVAKIWKVPVSKVRE